MLCDEYEEKVAAHWRAYRTPFVSNNPFEIISCAVPQKPAVLHPLLDVAIAPLQLTGIPVTIWLHISTFAGYSDFDYKDVLLLINPETPMPLLDVQYERIPHAPVCTLTTWQEMLVYVAAHEFRHCYQALYKQRQQRWLPGFHNKLLRELDAEYYAIQRLDYYRGTTKKTKRILQRISQRSQAAPG